MNFQCKIFLRDNIQFIQNFGLYKPIDDRLKYNYKTFAPMYKLTYRFDYNKCNDNSIYTFIINNLYN